MLANFLISSDTTIYKYFSFYEGNLVSADDPIMTQNYVTVSIELCLGNTTLEEATSRKGTIDNVFLFTIKKNRRRAILVNYSQLVASC